MRNKEMLGALFPGIRAKVLSATLLQPERWWFLTELADHLEVTASSLQRELESLIQAGLLLHRRDGRRAYFKANADSPIFPELRNLIDKTVGIGPALRDAFKKFGKQIEIAAIYGSVARGEENATSDVDLMVVGTLQQIDLVPVLRNLEKRFGRDVNVTLFSPKEFRRRRSSGDHFLTTVVKGKTILLKGRLNELEESAART